MAPDTQREQIGVFLNKSDKDDLEELAYRRRSNMSAVARELIEAELEDARRTGELETPLEGEA